MWSTRSRSRGAPGESYFWETPFPERMELPPTKLTARSFRGNSTSGYGRRASQFEILNFAVDGYVPTQFPAMAGEARPFSPDLYLVGLTYHDREVDWSDWSFHLFRLVSQRRDLRYPQLRELVKQSGASPADSEQVISEKLARYWDPITRWAFSELRATAAPAPVLVILLPSVNDPHTSQSGFGRTRQLLTEFGIPFIDISDCFAGIANMDALRVSPGDDHVTARGHQLIFDCLYLRWTGDPAPYWALVSGQSLQQ